MRNELIRFFISGRDGITKVRHDASSVTKYVVFAGGMPEISKEYKESHVITMLHVHEYGHNVDVLEEFDDNCGLCVFTKRGKTNKT